MKNICFSVILVVSLMAPIVNAQAPEIKTIDIIVEATGYSSTVDQTDSTPFVAANGTMVHDGVVAANFLAFGTKIRIPEVYGDRVFVIEDRMNKRFQNRIDIWFPDRASALKFGYKQVRVQILEN